MTSGYFDFSRVFLQKKAALRCFLDREGKREREETDQPQWQLSDYFKQSPTEVWRTDRTPSNLSFFLCLNKMVGLQWCCDEFLFKMSCFIYIGDLDCLLEYWLFQLFNPYQSYSEENKWSQPFNMQVGCSTNPLRWMLISFKHQVLLICCLIIISVVTFSRCFNEWKIKKCIYLKQSLYSVILY